MSKGKSGEHPAVIGYRAKLDSIGEHTVAEFDECLKKAKEAAAKASTIPAPPEPEPA